MFEIYFKEQLSQLYFGLVFLSQFGVVFLEIHNDWNQVSHFVCLLNLGPIFLVFKSNRFTIENRQTLISMSPTKHARVTNNFGSH